MCFWLDFCESEMEKVNAMQKELEAKGFKRSLVNLFSVFYKVIHNKN